LALQQNNVEMRFKQLDEARGCRDTLAILRFDEDWGLAALKDGPYIGIDERRGADYFGDG
jgi:hypothetical protein